MKERLQKILSRAGVCSRRKAEELIKVGKVRFDRFSRIVLAMALGNLRNNYICVFDLTPYNFIRFIHANPNLSSHD